MSTKKEVRAALKGKSGVNCFVKDVEGQSWSLNVVISVSTGEFGFDTILTCYRKCELIPYEVELELISMGIVEDFSTPALTPLQQALEDGRSVLCWVSDCDEDPTRECNTVDVINSHNTDRSEYPYEGDACGWIYATPVSEEYFLEV